MLSQESCRKKVVIAQRPSPDPRQGSVQGGHKDDQGKARRLNRRIGLGDNDTHPNCAEFQKTQLVDCEGLGVQAGGAEAGEGLAEN